MTTPISPADVKRLGRVVPPEIIQAFNETILAYWDGRESKFKQDEVMKKIVEKLQPKGVSRGDIYKNRWLDVESLYRAQGWVVTYDAPAYNESYPATFTFRSP